MHAVTHYCCTTQRLDDDLELGKAAITAPSSSAPHSNSNTSNTNTSNTTATHPVSSTEGSRSSAFAGTNPTTAAAATAAASASEAALPYRIDMDERGEVSFGNFKLNLCYYNCYVIIVIRLSNTSPSDSYAL
jgi:cytoskeletal protein RodZ